MGLQHYVECYICSHLTAVGIKTSKYVESKTLFVPVKLPYLELNVPIEIFLVMFGVDISQLQCTHSNNLYMICHF